MRCETPRKIYSTAWAISDSTGCFTLDFERFGVPKRTLQHWVKYFIRWHLCEVVDAGGGRGRRAIYKIKGKAEYLQQKGKTKPRNEAVKDKKIKTAVPDKRQSAEKISVWKKDKTLRREYCFQGWDTLKKSEYGWERCAQAFRIPFEEMGLPKPVASTITGLILSRLEGRSCQIARRLYSELGAYIWRAKKRLWGLIRKGIRTVCAWISWALTQLLKGQSLEEPKLKRQKREGTHGLRCECIGCERQRIAQRRAEAERAYGRTLPNLDDGRREPTRRLTVQDIALRFQLQPSQVRLICRCCS